MKAWQFLALGHPLRLVEMEDPVAAENQVVIDVKAAGLCHSDVGFMDGTLTPILAKIPIVLGHEVAGVVASIGPRVAGFFPGDRVAIAGFRSDARELPRTADSDRRRLEKWNNWSAFPIR